jgi:hypothetical protein
MTDRKVPPRAAPIGAFESSAFERECVTLALADRMLLPRQGDVAKLVALRRPSGRIWLLVYDRLAEPLIVADLDDHEVHLLRQILARVTTLS